MPAAREVRQFGDELAGLIDDGRNEQRADAVDKEQRDAQRDGEGAAPPEPRPRDEQVPQGVEIHTEKHREEEEQEDGSDAAQRPQEKDRDDDAREPGRKLDEPDSLRRSGRSCRQCYGFSGFASSISACTTSSPAPIRFGGALEPAGSSPIFSLSASKTYMLESDYVFQPRVFTELQHAQAIVVPYDGLNPLPPQYCYLKPHYLDPDVTYFEHVARGAL